jgi:aryl-alcohol dehydrogenase-like predicted oxidoreductase
MTALLTRAIPSTGELVPVVGLGTWQTFDVGPSAADRAPLERVLTAFAAHGGTLIDSSPMYGRAETVVGDLTAALGLSGTLFMATKVWTSGRATGIRQMEESMRRLQAQRIDLLQVHNLVDASTHLQTLADWKRDGRVRYVGVTHYTARHHDAVIRAMAAQPLDVVQINYSIAEREAEERLLPMARDRGIAVIVNRPFAEGTLMRRLKARPVPPWAAELGCGTWAQLLLKFVLSHPAVTCVIPATANVEHLEANMRAGLGPMPDQRLRETIVAEAGL